MPGMLSIDEADLITAAAVLDPAAESALVAKATSGHDLAEVREAAERVKRAARAGEDPGVRRARLRAARRWREWGDDGLTGIDARFVSDEWAAVRPVLDAFADAQFHANRKDGVRDSFDGYRADGLLAALAAAGAAVGLDLPALRPAETSAAIADSPAAPDRLTHAVRRDHPARRRARVRPTADSPAAPRSPTAELSRSGSTDDPHPAASARPRARDAATPRDGRRRSDRARDLPDLPDLPDPPGRRRGGRRDDGDVADVGRAGAEEGELERDRARRRDRVETRVPVGRGGL